MARPRHLLTGIVLSVCPRPGCFAASTVHRACREPGYCYLCTAHHDDLLHSFDSYSLMALREPYKSVLILNQLQYKLLFIYNIYKNHKTLLVKRLFCAILVCLFHFFCRGQSFS
jgi:hypothetical protein